MSALVLLYALGWAGAGPRQAWTLETHLFVAGISVAVWLLLMVTAARHHGECGRSDASPPPEVLDDPPSNVLAFHDSRRNG
jgi:hypothetical protein